MKHIMRIADSSGDTTVTWEIDKAEQVAEAQRQFEAMVNTGRQIFAFPVAGGPGEVAKTFDPKVEKYIIMPRAAGG